MLVPPDLAALGTILWRIPPDDVNYDGTDIHSIKSHDTPTRRMPKRRGRDARAHVQPPVASSAGMRPWRRDCRGLSGGRSWDPTDIGFPRGRHRPGTRTAATRCRGASRCRSRSGSEPLLMWADTRVTPRSERRMCFANASCGDAVHAAGRSRRPGIPRQADATRTSDTGTSYRPVRPTSTAGECRHPDLPLPAERAEDVGNALSSARAAGLGCWCASQCHGAPDRRSRDLVKRIRSCVGVPGCRLTTFERLRRCGRCLRLADRLHALVSRRRRLTKSTRASRTRWRFNGRVHSGVLRVGWSGLRVACCRTSVAGRKLDPGTSGSKDESGLQASRRQVSAISRSCASWCRSPATGR